MAGLPQEYEQLAGRTVALLVTVPDLQVTHPLPEAPWSEKGVGGGHAGCSCI